MEELNGLVSLADCDLLAKRDVLDFLTGGCGVVFDVSVLGNLMYVLPIWMLVRHYFQIDVILIRMNWSQYW